MALSSAVGVVEIGVAAAGADAGRVIATKTVIMTVIGAMTATVATRANTSS
jgi:hypothetical protein